MLYALVFPGTLGRERGRSFGMDSRDDAARLAGWHRWRLASRRSPTETDHASRPLEQQARDGTVCPRWPGAAVVAADVPADTAVGTTAGALRARYAHERGPAFPRSVQLGR